MIRPLAPPPATCKTRAQCLSLRRMCPSIAVSNSCSSTALTPTGRSDLFSHLTLSWTTVPKVSLMAALTAQPALVTNATHAPCPWHTPRLTMLMFVDTPAKLTANGNKVCSLAFTEIMTSFSLCATGKVFPKSLMPLSLACLPNASQLALNILSDKNHQVYTWIFIDIF